MNHNFAHRLLLIMIVLLLPVGAACAAGYRVRVGCFVFYGQAARLVLVRSAAGTVSKRKPEPQATQTYYRRVLTRDRLPAQPKPMTPAEPEPLTSAWLRKNMETYLNKAIDEPSHENVAAFYYLQRVMMDKAERFTNAARYVVMSDPQLDETVRRPVATYAANEANHQASVMADRVLKDIAGVAGILFFFRSDCPYCHVQAPILSMLETAYGFKIYPVSLGWPAHAEWPVWQLQSWIRARLHCWALNRPPRCS